MPFVAAIVGRPNVGKSTLFNRLAGQKLALVDDTPGVTRDRRRHEATLFDLDFEIIDTAGLEEAVAASLEGRMRQQTELAIEEADIIFFVVDAKNGLTPVDEQFANQLRKSGKPIVVVGNKAESRTSESGLADAWGLGLGEPVAISAEHGLGMPNLHEAVVSGLIGAGIDPQSDQQQDQAETAEVFEDGDDAADAVPTGPLRLAIVGRPNAGKSTLINTILGQDRLLTGPEAGITRDSISVDIVHKDRALKIFDTAGMRRRARINQKLEKLSVSDGLRAVRFAELVIVMIDSTIPLEKQDLTIADLIYREGRAPLIALNKWDLIDNRQEYLKHLREETARLLPQLRGIKVMPIAGETGEGVNKLLDAAFEVYATWNRRISTGRLNRWLEEATTRHPPPAVAGRRLRLKYIAQIKTRPPTFVLSCTRPQALPDSYLRYLVNGLRDEFGIPGVPIRIQVRAGKNPYEPGKKQRAR